MRRAPDFVRSLTFRLLAIASVPFIAVAVLADQRIDAERERREHAEALVEVIELRRTVVDVSAPAQLERISLEAFARLSQLGIPIPLVVAATGLDFEQMEAGNHELFERSLDALDSQFGSLVLADGAVLGDELATIRAELDTLRIAVDAGTADPGGVGGIFDRLDALLQRALASERQIDDHGRAGPGESEHVDHELMHALSTVIDTAGRRSNTLLETIIYNDLPNRDVLLVEAEARHAAAVDYYRELLSVADQATFDEVTALRNPVTPDVAGLIASIDFTSFDPGLISEATARLLGHNDYLSALDEYSDGVHATIDLRATAIADAAERDLHRTWWLLLVIGGVTLALVVAGAIAALLPLRRLTERAEALRAGNIDTDPLPVRGSNDVRALTRTTNEMVALLGRVEAEIHELAEGEIERSDDVDLPGAIGQSLRRSMHRLHAITLQLRRSEQLASAIVAGAADAIWTVAPDGTIITANDASAQMVGIAVDQQRGRPIASILSASAGEATVITPTSHDRRVLVSTSTVDSDGGVIRVVIAHDISARLDFERQLALQARRDPLTGLPNRLAVIERLSEISDGGQRAAVLFIDLDGFKAVNDLRGHAAGDDVLVEVARRLLDNVRGGDLVGRLGGDEFVVITRTLGHAELAELGNRLIRSIERPFSDEALIILSASIGVAQLDRLDRPEFVLSASDSALYQAKRTGRARIEFYDRRLQEEVALQAELELELRRAIPNGELELHLQPILDLATGQIDGAEALVRWRRAGHGLVLPSGFIPLAERSSLIIDIDRWVIERCCERLASWRQHPHAAGMRLAINISGRHLMEGNLVADVLSAIERTGADPSMLEIELTETHLLDDVERAIASLTELRDSGVRVSIDDFGSGYSAMNHLRQLPIDAIKIDRSYIVAATTNTTEARVIEAVMAIGRSHQLEVVAEGIESHEHLEFVRGYGCNRAQGFLIARPVPADDAEELIFGRARAGVL